MVGFDHPHGRSVERSFTVHGDEAWAQRRRCELVEDYGVDRVGSSDIPGLNLAELLARFTAAPHLWKPASYASHRHVVAGFGCPSTPLLCEFGAARCRARRGERDHRMMQLLSSDEALARLAECVDPHRDGVAIIAVDGHSASGKSTFAARMAARFDAAVVVEVDDFYRVLDPHVREQLDARGGVDQYYDWQRLRDVLTTIRSGRAARFEPYDWDRNHLCTSSKTIDGARLAIVEGLLAARPELDDLIDISVLVESPPSIRAARQRHRADASDDWLKRWDAAERLYLEVIRPATTFDLVVAGS